MGVPRGIGEGLPFGGRDPGGGPARGYRRRVRVLTWIFIGYLSLVLFVTLWPSPQSTAAPGWAEAVLDAAGALGIPLTLPVAEALANVVMFLPFGVLGTLLAGGRGARSGGGHGTGAGGARRVLPAGAAVRPAIWRAGVLVVLVGGLFSALIETVQHLIPGRVPTMQDVVLNTSGALVGAGLAVAIVAVASRRGRAVGRA